MQYLALLYTEAGAEPEYGTAAFDDMMQGYAKATKAFEVAGVMMGGEALEDTDKATSLRIRDGKTETIDGPFAETKERLGGFYLLDCKDLDHAIEMASLIPAVHYGTVELRPVMHVELPE